MTPVGNFVVSDGGIPEKIEEWLLENALWVSRDYPDKSQYVLSVTAGMDGEQYRFPWLHDREPTLAEAILAVANR